ncbi:MAG: ribosome silencing factor [Spirochaetales bacterium]
MNLKDTVNKIATAMHDKKAKNILIIDIKESTSLADYFIIGSVTSNTHAKGVMGYIEDELKQINLEPIRREGRHNSNWIVLDYGDIIVHIMETETREFYNLEKLWQNDKNTVEFKG